MKTLWSARIARVKRMLAWAGVVALLGAAGEARGQTTTTWTGTVSSDWTMIGNWFLTVPTSLDEADIDTNSGNQPILSGGTGAANFLDVGITGNGSGVNTLLTVNSTAVLTVGSFTVGDQFGSIGAVTVDGSGSQLLAGAESYVGNSGTGLLTVSNGGLVDMGSTEFDLGEFAGSNGTVVVNGGTLGNISTLVVGVSGTGNLTVNNGGNVTATSIVVSQQALATGTVTVDGTGSSLNAGTLNLGFFGNGTMSVDHGGVATTASNLYLGAFMGTTGTLTVNGTGSTFTAGDVAYIGGAGTGNLTITNGGVFNGSAGISVSDQSTGVGNVSVDGAGSKLLLGGATSYVGNNGNGTLTVTNGGVVDGGNQEIDLGEFSGSNGTVVVDGGTLRNVDNLVVGTFSGSNGTLTVKNGGNVTLAADDIIIGQVGPGTVTVDGLGTTVNVPGEILVGEDANGMLTLDHGATVTAHGVAVGDGPVQVAYLTVNGTGTTFNADRLGVGEDANATMTVDHGATVTVANNVIVGENSGGQGTLTVNGTGTTLNSGSGTTDIGEAGNGTVTVQNGAVYNGTLGGMRLGEETGSAGNFTVDGNGSELLLGGTAFLVGGNGTAALQVTNGGLVDVGGQDMELGSLLNGNGTVVVDGANSTLGNITTLVVGEAGIGNLSVTNGGNVTVAGNLSVGNQTGSVGAVTLSGAASSLTVNGTITLGQSGNGSLSITNGNVFNATTSGIALAVLAGSNGSLTVDGAGSQVLLGGTNLDVGYGGNGTLSVTNGGLVDVGGNDVILGNQTGGNGTVTVDGTGSVLGNFTTLIVGDAGRGNLTVTNGAAMDADLNNVILGNQTGGNGTVTVDGAGSSLGNIGILAVGEAGNGTMAVQNGANVTAQSVEIGWVSGGNGAMLVTGSGTIMNTTSVFVGDGGAGALAINSSAIWDNGGGQVDVADAGGSTGAIVVNGGIFQNISIFDVGCCGNGSLAIIGGGSVTAEQMEIAVMADTPGAVTVSGPNSTLTLTGFAATTLVVGESGNGTLLVDNEAILDNGGKNGDIGELTGSNGLATVNGTAAWTNISTLTVGDAGNGTLMMGNGASLSAMQLFVGYQAGGYGNVTVDGNGTILSPGAMVLGEHGNGTVTVQNGGSLQTSSTLIGDILGTTGTITVTGTGSNFTVYAGLTVGEAGNGTLNILSNGTVDNQGSFATLGDSFLSNGGGMVTVDGGTWTNITTLTVGEWVNGTLLVEDGGNVSAATLVAGDQSISYGNIDITGANTTVTMDGTGSATLISNQGTGSLTVSDFALLDNGGQDAQIGVSGAGNVTVDNAQWTNIGELTVGGSGSGSLTVTNGGNVSATDVYLATGNQFVTDILTVTGTNSTLTSAGYIVVGDGGTGEMNILNGGNVTVADVSIGNSPIGEGFVTVDGANSTLTVTGVLNVGVASYGNLTISGGGAVQAGLLNIAENMNTSANVDVTGTNSTLTLDGAEVGVYEYGILSVENGGTVTVTPGNTIALGLTPGGTGEVDVGGGGTLQIGGADGISQGSGNVSFNLLGGTVKIIGSDFSTAVAATLATSTTSVIDTNGFNASWDGVIGGAGNLTKSGLGKLTLSGVNGYTGLTTVSAGRLDVTGSLAGEMLVCSGATLGGNGTLTNSVTLNTGGKIVPAFGGPSLTLGNLTWGGSTNGNATAYFTLSDVDNTASLLTVTGDFTKGAGTTFKFDFGGTGEGNMTSPTVYTLISFGSLFDGGNGTFNIADFSYINLGGGPSEMGTFAYSGNNLTFSVVPEPADAAAVAGVAAVMGVVWWRSRRKGVGRSAE